MERRRPLQVRRSRSVLVRYSEEEYARLSASAESAGLSTTSYAAEAALAAANGTSAPADTAVLRELLVELMAARTQLRRFGVNVNQAVAQLNATGEAPVWLQRSVHLCERAVGRLDETTAAVTRRLR
jgi:hypothetical protein